jgi:hypothetical protein
MPYDVLIPDYYEQESQLSDVIPLTVTQGASRMMMRQAERVSGSEISET